jgi:hypothetical protein
MWRQSRLSARPSCFDNGAYSEWRAAQKRGEEWFIRQDWSPYFEWLEPRLFQPGRWAVIPDAPGAPSQINDSLLTDWPFGQKGAPLWHMDGPLDRLLRLCDQFDRVCLGWTGKGKHLDCPEYHARMDEVAAVLGNRWPVLHMMRGVMVAHDYPFTSADSTSLAQNGWRRDSPLFTDDPWRGRRAYADKLEGLNRRVRDSLGGASEPGRGFARPHMGSRRMVAGRGMCGQEEGRANQLSLDF